MIIVQARSTSKRFPNKSMSEIGGYPMIHWVLSGCLPNREFHKIILAIPYGSAELMLREYVSIHFPEIEIIQGDENDVYSRFQTALTVYREVFESEDIGIGLVRVCADRPLISPQLISRLKHHDDKNFELLFNHEVYGDNGPSGIGAESLSKPLAKELFSGKRRDWIEREHVTARLYELEPHLCKSDDIWRSIEFQNSFNYSVDSPIDLEVINSIVDEFSILPGDEIPVTLFMEFESFLCRN